MLTANDIESWVIVWIVELAILAQFIIKNHLKKKPDSEKPKKSEIIGITILIIAAQFSLIYTVGNYILDYSGDTCLAIAITQEPLNKDKVWKCTTEGNEEKWILLVMNASITVITLFIQIPRSRQ